MVLGAMFVSNIGNYSDIQTLYIGYFASKLLWNVAFFFIAVIVYFKLKERFQAMVEVIELKYFMIFFLLVGTGIFMFSTIDLAKDLASRYPSKAEGIIVSKEQRLLIREGYENHIRLNTIAEDLVVVGDSTQNGFDTTTKGDTVQILYGNNTDTVFLIKKLQKK